MVKYGRKWGDGFSEFEIELWAIKADPSKSSGGVGKLGHFKKAVKIIWPHIRWHEWNEAQVESFLENETISWTGAATAGKTFTITMISMIWWLMSRQTTSIIMTSTSATRMRERFWSAMQQLYYATAVVPESSLLCNGFPGVLIENSMSLRAEKPKRIGNKVNKDGGLPNKCGIFAIAIREGKVSKAVGDIQGIHNERVVVVLDEASETAPAIMEALPNLRMSCKDFKLVLISNPVSKLDLHGQCSEPDTGWASVNVDSYSWRTKGVSKWTVNPGLCIHFDGMKSPNMIRGKDEFSYLISIKDFERHNRTEETRNSISCWKFFRGFWPPDGVCKALMSFSFVEKHDGRGTQKFLSYKTPTGSLDPAFGGDECILQFAEMGDIDGGLIGVQLTETIVIEVSATSDQPMEYQIAARVIAECEARHVLPRHFGVDATGTGRGVASILQNDWGPIIRVEFSGSPSDRMASQNDMRPASAVYDRKVTELHCSVRELIENGQLKGLTAEQITEFCYRRVEPVRAKLSIQSKEEARIDIGHSPDRSDAVAIVVEVARMHGAAPKGSVTKRKGPNMPREIAKRYNSIHINTFTETSYDTHAEVQELAG